MIPAIALANALRHSTGIPAGHVVATGTYTGLKFIEKDQAGSSAIRRIQGRGLPLRALGCSIGRDRSASNRRRLQDLSRPRLQPSAIGQPSRIWISGRLHGPLAEPKQTRASIASNESQHKNCTPRYNDNVSFFIRIKRSAATLSDGGALDPGSPGAQAGRSEAQATRARSRLPSPPYARRG